MFSQALEGLVPTIRTMELVKSNNKTVFGWLNLFVDADLNPVVVGRVSSGWSRIGQR